jgi:hypothetical protein
MSSGVALIGLEGVNLVFLRVSLQVSPKFMTTFSVLPDPIPYSESELLSLRRGFRFLVSHFLRTFSSLSNFSLNCAKDCFVGLGFFPPFLAARKSAFSVPSFSKRRQSQVLWVVYAPPCFFYRSQCFSVRTFFGTLRLSVPGRFVPFFLLCKGFSLQEGLDLLDPSCPHTRSIALRD